jgi:hypothetical protein
MVGGMAVGLSMGARGSTGKAVSRSNGDIIRHIVIWRMEVDIEIGYQFNGEIL